MGLRLSCLDGHSKKRQIFVVFEPLFYYFVNMLMVIDHLEDPCLEMILIIPSTFWAVWASCSKRPKQNNDSTPCLIAGWGVGPLSFSSKCNNPTTGNFSIWVSVFHSEWQHSPNSFTQHLHKLFWFCPDVKSYLLHKNKLIPQIKTGLFRHLGAVAQVLLSSTILVWISYCWFFFSGSVLEVLPSTARSVFKSSVANYHIITL